MQKNKRELKESIKQALCKDRRALHNLFNQISSASSDQMADQHDRFLEKLKISSEKAKRRGKRIPQFDYPENLPISKKKEAIINAIKAHQVVVITGETGSGKTTQIPKMCLEAGRGRYGKIACTQPRRIAATSLAKRVSIETGTELGQEIGYKIRFDNKSQASTLIQFVTDGILLAETQHDRFLSDYDTIIIDEAHERTLNIDFLLGYLKQLLSKRADLKLIITSATIDVIKFSKAFPQSFNPFHQAYLIPSKVKPVPAADMTRAPVIEVSGRTYPVEVRYSPIDESQEDRGDISMTDLVKDAVEEILTETSKGDILVFMSGIQEIKETSEHLKYLNNEGFDILPLFGRLTNSEQNRIFQTGSRRKIIISTNIAETSITIPRIRYVVDTGRARISQYNTRSGTQGLPIKAISQSSANQRKGRCGRIANGICIRLYSKEDFILRDEYSTPEIQRSDLADVILQMLSLKLGDIQTFPFIDVPNSAQIRAGFRTLQELGAMDSQKKLTHMGREMATLPVDPRTARMILQAKEENALYEVLIIASGISCLDPRERPEDKQSQADQKHAAFVSRASDLMTILTLWENYHSTLEELKTQNKMRKFCKANFLSYRRIREWRDIHKQLTIILEDKNWKIPIPKSFDYGAIHKSILSGYLMNIAQFKEKKQYQGTKNRELTIFPASGQGRSRHKWIVAIELIETSRLWAHRVAQINPEWLESLAEHLVKKSWSEPHWDIKTSRVVAWEKVTLFGFTLVEKRRVNYGPINLEASNLIFIREALIEEKLECSFAFWKHNRALTDEIREMENQTRKRNLLVPDSVLEAFYEKRLSGISCLNDLKKVIKKNGNDRFLFLQKEDVLQKDPDHPEDLFPQHFKIGSKNCRLEYVFEPGHPNDGVSIEIPPSLLNSLQKDPFEYLVPGLLQEKIFWLLKNLPKHIRKKLVPIPEKADRVWNEMISLKYSSQPDELAAYGTNDFYKELSDTLFKITRLDVPVEEWDRNSIPEYLRMNFLFKSPKTGRIIHSRILDDLQGKNKKKKDDWKKLIKPYEQSNIVSWDFPQLVEEVRLSDSGDVILWGYRTLKIEGEMLKLSLSKSLEEAEQKSLAGVNYLLKQELGEDLSWIYQQLRFPPETINHFEGLWTGNIEISAISLQKKFGGKISKSKSKFHTLLQEKTNEMVCRGLCGYNGQSILTKKGFINRVEKVRKETIGLGNRVVEWINTTIAMRQKTLELLALNQMRRKGPLWELIQNEVIFFLSNNCLNEIPLELWTHCPRILKSYQKRIEKYLSNPAKEEETQQELFALQQQCEEIWQTRNTGDLKRDWALTKYRWMLEEFKLSVYTQELKTAFPISRKRLDKFLKETVL